MTLNLNVVKSTNLDHYRENIAGFSVTGTYAYISLINRKLTYIIHSNYEHLFYD